MKNYIINGGTTLSGTINIDGSKNAALALIPAALLTKGKVILENVPDISDIHDMLEILKELNVHYSFSNNVLIIDSSHIQNKALTNDKIRKIRASYYFMGALLSLFKNVNIASPGGCKIGNRPINYHLVGFKKMGVTINETYDIYNLTYDILNNATIILPFPSVGTTINLVLASVMSDNVFIIDNISCEPEVIQVISFLKKCGAKIKRISEKTIVVIGVRKLNAKAFKVMNDRIEAGTYCIIGALIGDNLTIQGINKVHLLPLLEIFDYINVVYSINIDSITFYKSNLLNNINIETAPYPLFPTDLQQPLCVLATQLASTSIIYENIYHERNAHIYELNKMGAKINVINNKIIIEGKTKLIAQKVSINDLRGGAALLIASLIANGTSYLSNIHYIERGYPNIITKLNTVGAKIRAREI